jgi:hypothetical protein
MNQATTRQVLFVNCKSVDGNPGLSNLKAKAEFKLIFMDELLEYSTILALSTTRDHHGIDLNYKINNKNSVFSGGDNLT